MLASFLAAAVALLPVFLMALLEISSTPSGLITAGTPDDSGYRGAGLALAAMPFLYIFAVPVCYAVGALLRSCRLFSLLRFCVGAGSVAFFLGLAVGVLLSDTARFGAGDLAISIFVSTSLLLVTALPAAFIWWLLAVRPHNPAFQRTAARPLN